MLRGDDVADLQRRLSALGFDTGRVDGIFGPLTATALAELQRNLGLPPDGICGRSTLSELFRVMPRHGDPELVTTVRDRELLRQSPRTIANRRVAVGEEGGLDVMVASITRHLSGSGAEVIPVWHPDGSAQASIANLARADVYIGLRLDHQSRCCKVAYYAGYRYESPGGKRLAESVMHHVSEALDITGSVRGMSVPVLRETQMPAVICEVGSASDVVRRGPELSAAVSTAVAAWAESPL